MKKRLISLILAAIVLLSCAFAEESQSEEYLLPYIDLYAVPLGENAIFEIPKNGATRRGCCGRAADDLPPDRPEPNGDGDETARRLEATDASDALGMPVVHC